MAFVVAVPAFAKLSTGNGSCSMVTVRPPLFAPVSFPERVTAPPNFTVVELARDRDVAAAGLRSRTVVRGSGGCGRSAALR